MKMQWHQLKMDGNLFQTFQLFVVKVPQSQLELEMKWIGLNLLNSEQSVTYVGERGIIEGNAQMYLVRVKEGNNVVVGFLV